MREAPTWRIPFGVLALCVALALYGMLVVTVVGPLISGWHALLQTPVWIVLGVAWLLPLQAVPDLDGNRPLGLGVTAPCPSSPKTKRNAA